MAKKTTRRNPSKSAHRRTSKRHVTHAVRRHYNRVMPAQSHHRAIVWVVFLCVVGIIAVQMLYPLDRAVPLARLGDRWVGGQQHQQLSEQLTVAFQRSQVAIDVGDGAGAPQRLSTTGATLNAESMVAELEEYPFWQRFIPLSILWQFPRVAHYDVAYEPTILDGYAAIQSKKLSFAPTNASLELRDGKLVATNEKPGRQVAPGQIAQAVTSAPLAVGVDTVVKVVGVPAIPPAKTSRDFDVVRTQAAAALARNVILRVRDQTVTPTAEQRASWFELVADVDGRTKLGINHANFTSYTNTELNTKFARAAGQSHLTMVNGIVTNRIEGVPGEQVDQAALLAQLQPYLLDGVGAGEVVVGFAPVTPQIIYNNRYTATQEGLAAYARDQAVHGAWISIRQIGGNGWSVDADADQSIPSASTFKLFVAKELFDRMNNGQIRWGDPILDTTVSGCFDRMTIASTNPCAREWLRQFGRSYMNEKMWSLGFSRGTSFTRPQAVHTTAGDLTRMMVGIENGSLMSGANRDRLYRSLSTHPYRYGIPTGSKATKVYDKVGFLWDYVHDTAIVYHPRGTYVMTIMTKGKSYAAIARMTREIEALMYP